MIADLRRSYSIGIRYLLDSNSWQLRLFTGFAILALTLRFIALALVPLVPEEAYYWMYATHPNLSYYDHPPMVALVIATGTLLFGDTEFGVRIIGCLLMCFSSALIYLYGKIWFGRITGLWSAVLLQTIPFYYGLGFIATMDSALIFFWMLCLVGLSFALKKKSAWGWYLAGLGLGGALLSKYTGIFLAMGTFLILIVTRKGRANLRKVHPYFGLVIGILLFTPVLMWNYQHDWASFRFQFLDRYGNAPISLQTIFEFIGFQLLVATPAILAISLWLYIRNFKSRRCWLSLRTMMTISFSLPLLFVLSYKSLRYNIHLNWTAPLYLSLLPGCVFMALGKVRSLGLSTGFNILRSFASWSFFIYPIINFVLVVYLLIVEPKLHAISAFGPWIKLANVVEEYEERLEQETGREPLIVGDGKYRLASVVAFYRTQIDPNEPVDKFTTSQWIFGAEGLGFPYWAPRDKWEGQNCIYLGKRGDTDKIMQWFDSVEMVNDDRVDRIGAYQIAICKGLRLTPSLVVP